VKFEVLHQDHGITSAQAAHIQERLVVAVTEGGFFIQQVEIPANLGTVPCGLYGPAMGDAPVSDEDVILEARGDRAWQDRLLDKPYRQVGYVQTIGIRDDSGFTVFTMYGGPLAPQNPEDPTNNDPKGARQWWAEHALSR